MLVEFASVVDAVECAAAIHRAMVEREADVAGDRRILYRAGINLGDSVNVAARLEALAEPGEIIFSNAAYDQVRGRVDVTFEYLGEQGLKNLPEPIRVHRVLLDGAARAPSATARKSHRLNTNCSLAAVVFADVVGCAVGRRLFLEIWLARLEALRRQRH